MKKKGVGFHKAAGKWYATISINAVNTHLGLFDTFEDAVKKREEAEITHHYKDVNIFKPNLSQQDLKEVLHYDPSTGVFTWNVNYGGHVIKGRQAGGIDKDIRNGGKTYRRLKVYKQTHMAHRLAFLYMLGHFPDCTDHIDGNGLNNRWDNLRSVTVAENNKNARRRVDNSSGLTGVSFLGRINKWQVYISDSGKLKYLGVYEDFFEACCARKSAENSLNYHKNHGQIRPL